jgi:D-glycero-D-manno-heptose 1,7-bisphosphate phosphatase
MKLDIKLIILDRDGVINYDSVNYIKSINEWIPIPGSIKAIADLSKHGFTIAIATNQSGIARNYLTIDTLNKMHDILTTQVISQGGKISSIKFCPHHPDDNCSCRKPKPGMLLEILQKTNIPATQAIMLGDSVSDMQAAINANCQAVWIKSNKPNNYFDNNADLYNKKIVVSNKPINIFSSLQQFADALLLNKINF